MAPQRRGWVYLCDISLENTPTSHAVSLALFMYKCIDSSMPFYHVLAYTIIANGVCLHFLVSSLAQCFFYSVCGYTFKRKVHTLCKNFIKKRGLSLFREIMVACE